MKRFCKPITITCYPSSTMSRPHGSVHPTRDEARYLAAKETSDLALFAHMAAENALKVALETGVDSTLIAAMKLTVAQCQKAAKNAQEKFHRAHIERIVEKR
jgi:hypothetical protein